MAEGVVAKMSAALPYGGPPKPEKIAKILQEDYDLDSKDCTALKIICLGDSAVGKSK